MKAPKIINRILIKEALLFLLFLGFFHLGTQVSLLFQVESGWSKLYFPTAMGIVLVHWFGPRILIPLFINSVLSSGLWGIPNSYLSPLSAIPEVTTVFFSWFIFNKLYKGKCWIPDIKSLISYLILAVITPVLIFIIILELQFNFIPTLSFEFNPVKTLNTLLAEFVTYVSISIPLLYFFSHQISRLKLSVIYKKPSLKYRFQTLKSKGELVRVILLVLVIVVLNFFVDFIDYWFVFGILAILVSAKWGFSFSVMANLAIFINTYVIYYLFYKGLGSPVANLEGENKIYLGLSLLFVATYIIGRVISDNTNANVKLEKKNNKLKKVNEELDRFVYSVSHDLSSPLKSIKGLLNLASAESDHEMLRKYLHHINKSTIKLDEFIKELLDFSRSSRAKLSIKKINLESMLESSLNGYTYDDEYVKLEVSLDLKCKDIYSDELRVKIILNNLISNAIKYRKKDGEPSFLNIKSRTKGEMVCISFEDNGLGMEKEVLEKAFDIFYRGSAQSTGSGLGLYILKESLNKLKGKISVKSKKEIGSTFLVEIPNKKGS